ncbi:uncharacterized protein B4U79_10838, partial [Dinothrombium tinctorium]
GFVALLFIIGPEHQKVGDVNCPSCEILKERNADNNTEDECHEFYDYVCTDITPESISEIHSQHSIKTEEKPPSSEPVENYAKYDQLIHEHQKQFSFIVAENLKNRKNYMASLVQLPEARGRSAIPFEGVDELHADINLINKTFYDLFSYQRNAFFDRKYKKRVRKSVLQRFQSYGLKSEVQKFPFLRWFNGSIVDANAQNLIGILPSQNYGKPEDKIFLIGGHYDTVYRNPGVDDNGSGSIAVLECARILSKYKDRLDATVYFVLFDQEESGLDGSIAFVDEYMVPKVIDKTNATFIGAYVTDMVLLYDDTPNIQTLPEDFIELSPQAAAKVKSNSNKGDFISVWARDADRILWETLQTTWDEMPAPEYKLIVFNTSIEANYWNLTYDHMYTTFVRSDHASFWQSARKHPHVETLPAVLLCDLGPWRGYQRKCYHQPCDNKVQLTDKNFQFMAKIINAVVKSTLKIIGNENVINSS